MKSKRVGLGVLGVLVVVTLALLILPGSLRVVYGQYGLTSVGQGDDIMEGHNGDSWTRPAVSFGDSTHNGAGADTGVGVTRSGVVSRPGLGNTPTPVPTVLGVVPNADPNWITLILDYGLGPEEVPMTLDEYYANIYNQSPGVIAAQNEGGAAYTVATSTGPIERSGGAPTVALTSTVPIQGNEPDTGGTPVSIPGPIWFVPEGYTAGGNVGAINTAFFLTNRGIPAAAVTNDANGQSFILIIGTGQLYDADQMRNELLQNPDYFINNPAALVHD